MSASRGRSGGSHPQGVVTPLKRRSARKSATMKQTPDSLGLPELWNNRPWPIAAPFVKRSITAKKILPRKTLPTHVLAVARSSPRVSNTTSVPRSSPRVSSQDGKENSQEATIKRESVSRSKSSPASLLQNQNSLSFVQNSSSVAHPSEKQHSNNVLSPIPTSTVLNVDEPDSAMSKKVRRSYSRLEMSLHRSSFVVEQSPASQDESSDTSTPNHSRLSRRSCFGFDNLLSQDALADVSPVTKTGARLDPGPEVQTEMSLNVSKVLDTHLPDISVANDIPGIPMAKEKRKRRKIPQIDKSDLDEWAAQMNAQFEEAEKFDLLVE